MLDVDGCERFEGRGVYHAATPMEAQMCRGSEVVVVVVGNSAGQAAVFVSGQVRKVYLVVRGEPDGKTPATGSGDDTVRLWDTAPIGR